MTLRRRANCGSEDVNALTHFRIRMDTEDLDTAFRGNARRPMEPTMFFEVEVLQVLGLYDEVKRHNIDGEHSSLIPGTHTKESPLKFSLQ